TADAPLDFDAFVLECCSAAPHPFKLTLTYDVYEGDRRRTIHRHAFDVRPGHNFHVVPFERFRLSRSGFLSLYPEESAGEPRLIFTWLDFVKWKAGRGPASPGPLPATTIKCVAWDLDGTLWDGTLVETERRESLALRPGVWDLIRTLDERGVI